MNGVGRKLAMKRQQLLVRASAGMLFLLSLFFSAGCRSGQNVNDTLAPTTAELPFRDRDDTLRPSLPITKEPARSGVVQTNMIVASARQEDREATGEKGSVLVLPALQPTLDASPIDLPSALRLAGAENPTIAIAEEAVRASLAEQLRARTLLLPDLSAGFNYDDHFGTLQSARGIIRDLNRQALYVGTGAAAMAAGTVAIPGVRITAQLADAVFEPRVARQRVTARRFDAVATRHNLLLEVASRYFELEGAEARLLALRQSEQELRTIQEITRVFSLIGLGRDSDSDRARTEVALQSIAEERAEEDIQVQSAELSRLLNVDPSRRLRAEGRLPTTLQLVAPQLNLEQLIQIALSNRPEIGARSADVAVNEGRLRKEQVRPFVPFISVGFSAGGFGGGSDQVDSRFGHFGSRTDFDALAVWSFQGLGLANVAVQRKIRAEVREAIAERTRVIDSIRQEVAEAFALVRQRRLEIAIARKRVETSGEAYRLDLIRVRNAQGLPIEVLNSAQLLNVARQDLIGASVAYNQAQFRLFVALGNAPADALVP
jgi:outer membrane protein TolC